MIAQRMPATAKPTAEIILGVVDPSSIIFQIMIADAKKNIKVMIRAIGRLVILFFIFDSLLNYIPNCVDQEPYAGVRHITA
jgi:hypothetical protein